MKVFLFLLVGIFSTSGLATDCNSDCEGHFDKWYQGPDLLRCQTEREVACETGITSCDIWKYNPQTTASYLAAIAIVEQATRATGWPDTSNACHSAVELGNTAASAAGAAKFLYKVWNYGFQLAELLSQSTIIGLVVSEGAKHFAHCVCTNASHPQAETSTPGNDRFFVSLFNDNWSVWRGANTPQNRKELYQKALSDVGGSFRKRNWGAYSSQKRTLTEAICEEGTYWATRTAGDESSKHVAQTVNERDWDKCLFRTTNFPQGSPHVSDKFYASLSRKTGAWALRTGNIEDKDSILQAAKDAMNGRWDRLETGRYSSTRLTSTTVTCVKQASSSGGLQIEDATLFLTGGFGTRSAHRALEVIRKKHQGEACVMNTRDVDFGPLQ